MKRQQSWSQHWGQSWLLSSTAECEGSDHAVCLGMCVNALERTPRQREEITPCWFSWMALCGCNFVNASFLERKNRLGGNENAVVLRDPDPYLTFPAPRHGGGQEELCAFTLNIEFRHCNPSVCSKKDSSCLGNVRKANQSTLFWQCFGSPRCLKKPHVP